MYEKSKNIELIRQKIEKVFGIKLTDGLTPDSFFFTANLKRFPKFQISGNASTEKFSLVVDADKNGDRQIVYSGSNFSESDLIYMINVELTYFKNLKL